jgi:hypothetical protein
MSETGKLCWNIQVLSDSNNICNFKVCLSLTLLTILHIQHGGHKFSHRFCYIIYQEQIIKVPELSCFYIPGYNLRRDV